MKNVSKKFLMLLMTVTLVFSTCITSFAAASGVTSSTAYKNLYTIIKAPSEISTTVLKNVGSSKDASEFANLAQKEYTAKDGGYVLYSELVPQGGKAAKPVDETQFNKLTTGAKQKFLKDLFTVANIAAAYGSNSSVSATAKGKFNGITTQTVQILYERLETYEGMGSVLMASIMENTKPDFSSANKIYEPFSGLVGTILGLIAVLIMALLGITMALDIAYIVIPTVQLMLDGSEGNGGAHAGGPGQGHGQKKGLSGLVSQAARNAVQAANGGQGGQGQGGEGNKMAIGVYFKYRWLELVVLGICLLYLVSGNIYSFVAWILDLVSGFLGF